MVAAVWSSELLTMPVAVAVRQLAQARLAEAEAACLRLDDPEDAEALHDVRVALRRLRTLLGAYGAEPAAALSPKWRRRLGRLVRRTNGGRDAEVSLQLLEDLRGRDRLAAHLRGLRGALQREVLGARGATGVEFREQFLPLARRLRTKWSGVWVWQPLAGSPALAPSHGVITATVVTREAATLRRLLAKVAGPRDSVGQHDARIAAKRLRYVLEPLMGLVPGVDGLVDTLRRVQTVLGDLHDLGVLRARLDHVGQGSVSDAGLGVPGLVVRLEAQRLSQWRSFLALRRSRLPRMPSLLAVLRRRLRGPVRR